MLLLISDKTTQLEVIFRWTFVYDYILKLSTNQRGVWLWCHSKKHKRYHWDFTSGVFIGWSWVHRDTTSNWVLSDVRGSVAYYKMILISLHHKNIDRIGGVMVSVLVWSAVDRGFELRSGQTKDLSNWYLLLLC